MHAVAAIHDANDVHLHSCFAWPKQLDKLLAFLKSPDRKLDGGSLTCSLVAIDNKGNVFVFGSVLVSFILNEFDKAKGGDNVHRFLVSEALGARAWQGRAA